MARRIKAKHQQVASLEAEMLRRVRTRGGLSRIELARELQLAPSTAGIYVDRLVRDGFLQETESLEREAVGRPPTALVPNPDGGRFVGVDFEARNLMATVVDFSQQPLRQVHQSIRPADSAAQIVAKITQAIQELMAGDARPVLGIGVGVPGTIDPVRNVAVHYEFIRDWRDVPLGARLSEQFSVPVYLENNIRSMALAELWFGAGRGLQDFVCVGIRSGIAAGVVIGGHLLHGARHRAGEIGRWVCPAPAELMKRELVGSQVPDRGGRGSSSWEPRLEQVASLSAIVAAAQRGRQDGRKTSLTGIAGDVTIDDVLAAARQGDEFSGQLVRAAARLHGWVAHQLDQLFDPQQIIFAGPLAESDDLFLATVRETARQLDDTGREPVVVNSPLGRYNGAVGAAALALHRWKPKR
jgi:N-acetylglucosamine repressor